MRRIYSTKKMIKLNKRVCDIDTRRDIYLTPAGGVVRAIYKWMEIMEGFGFTGKEMYHMEEVLRAMERKKRPLVVTDQAEQYGD